MDRTKFFKEICGLMVLERGEDCGSENALAGAPAAKRSPQAYKILRSITTMKDFLLSRRHDYVLCALSPESRSARVDWERRRTDLMVEQLARDIRAAIDAFFSSQKSCDSLRSLQAREHRRNVRLLLLDYLSTTCRIYAEMKAVYVKRVCDRRRWSRLNSPYRRLGPSNAGGSPSFVPAPLIKGLRQLHRWSSAASKMVTVGSWFQSAEEGESPRDSTALDVSLTHEECMQFEEESKILMDRLNCPREIVRDIESQVIDIACLQRILTSHIIEQEDNVERVAMATQHASANVTAASRTLEYSVVQRTSSGRWAAALIFWLSLLLLFLHWLMP